MKDFDSICAMCAERGIDLVGTVHEVIRHLEQAHDAYMQLDIAFGYCEQIAQYIKSPVYFMQSAQQIAQQIDEAERIAMVFEDAEQFAEQLSGRGTYS